MSVRELARQAGISHTQVSRIESGQVKRPSRLVLVSIARGLDRNPIPLLVLAGHLGIAEAQEALRPLFRKEAELLEEWGDWTTFDLTEVNRIIRDPDSSMANLERIAADVFHVEETDETLWDDSYQVAASGGEGARDLQEFMLIWRYVPGDLRQRWLKYGRLMRDVADLEFRAEMERDLPPDRALRDQLIDRIADLRKIDEKMADQLQSVLVQAGEDS